MRLCGEIILPKDKIKKTPQPHEIIAAICADMHGAFGGREYSKVQQGILERLLLRYGERNFTKISADLLENGSRKPYPIDFKNALQNLSQDLKPRHAHQDYEVQCFHCMDTGYVFLKKEFVENLGKPVVALCRCSIGRQMRESDEKLPRADFNMWGFVDTFPVHKFKPARRSDPLKSTQNVTHIFKFEDIVKKWSLLKKQSRDYWKNHGGKYV